uniref:H15 domain-containing protein n=1 Tax=Hippocampus comes TaxID=109280 RepID=A0A3Q2XN39_HIPCM
GAQQRTDPPRAAPAGGQKVRRAARKRTAPTVSILILNAISSYGGSRGVSLVALKKVLKVSGYDVTRNRARIRLALRRLVAKKVIVRTRGKGASGSFKLNPKPKEERCSRSERRLSCVSRHGQRSDTKVSDVGGGWSTGG